MPEQPSKIFRWVAYRENGTVVYSGTATSESELEFYRDGHSVVHRLEVTEYVRGVARELPVDRSPERLATWAERNGR